jgi:hypothetical protein
VLHTFRNAEDKTLENYAWVDKAAGTVRLPIDRAIDLVVERGFPVRPAAPAATAAPLKSATNTTAAAPAAPAARSAH